MKLYSNRCYVCGAEEWGSSPKAFTRLAYLQSRVLKNQQGKILGTCIYRGLTLTSDSLSSNSRFYVNVRSWGILMLWSSSIDLIYRVRLISPCSWSPSSNTIFFPLQDGVSWLHTITDIYIDSESSRWRWSCMLAWLWHVFSFCKLLTSILGMIRSCGVEEWGRCSPSGWFITFQGCKWPLSGQHRG